MEIKFEVNPHDYEDVIVECSTCPFKNLCGMDTCVLQEIKDEIEVEEPISESAYKLLKLQIEERNDLRLAHPNSVEEVYEPLCNAYYNPITKNCGGCPVERVLGTNCGYAVYFNLVQLEGALLRKQIDVSLVAWRKVYDEANIDTN